MTVIWNNLLVSVAEDSAPRSVSEIPGERKPSAVGEHGFRRAAARSEGAVERGMLAVVAAGIEAFCQANGLLAEAADRVGGKGARDAVRPQVAPVGDGRAEPAPQLALDLLQIGVAGTEDRGRDERAARRGVARGRLTRHAEVVDRA